MSDLRIESNTFAFWTSLLQSVWCDKRHHLIDLILDTERVREHWLQGDVFLAARTWQEPRLPFFYCNYKPWGYGGAVDWSYWDSDDYESHDPTKGAKPWMLAEIKVIGGSYLPKTFAGEGFNLGRFIENNPEGTCIKPDHWALSHPRLGGLLKDYRRLISYTRHACLRILVLVLDTRGQDTQLGRCLNQVQFDGPGEVVVESARWLCKAWEITSAC